MDKKDHIYYLIIMLLICLMGALVIISDTQTNYLEKENELLRQELNIKNGDLWEQQIKQNMEKDQPIYF